MSEILILVRGNRSLMVKIKIILFITKTPALTEEIWIFTLFCKVQYCHVFVDVIVTWFTISFIITFLYFAKVLILKQKM